MIELKSDALVFTYPEVHPEASLTIDFQRTLRIPDDGKTYPLPPGLGRFPLRHVDDHAETAPPHWIAHGGVMMPMYQAEALWLYFHPRQVSKRHVGYPFAIKVAAGKIDAVTGNAWTNGIHKRPQDYVVAPKQPWLDGFCVKKGVIRQFVAMPLGSGYTAEEQLTGEAEHGGLQIVVYPMKREVFERRFPERDWRWALPRRRSMAAPMEDVCCMKMDMGLAPGGRMKQKIYDDPYDFDDWDLEHGSRCFVHIANSLVWEAVTGKRPPSPPPTAASYERAGLPWFDLYDEGAAAVDGSKRLAEIKSVIQMAREKGEVALPENESVEPDCVLKVGTRRSKAEVREGEF